MTESAVRLPRAASLRQWYAASTRRTKVLVGVAVAGVILAVLLGVAFFRLYQVAGHLSTARTQLLRSEQEVRAGQISQAQGDIRSAEGEIVAATNILHGSRELNLAGSLPVLRQNLQSVKRSVALVFQMADSGRRLLDIAKPLVGPDGRVNVALTRGTVPLDTVVSLQDELQELTFSLPGPPDVPSSTFLIGRVAELQKTVFTEAVRRRQEFASVGHGLSLLGDMAGANGPRRYLVAVANAAEMRGTGGMILSYGVLTSSKGTFKLERFGPIDEIALSSAADVKPIPSYVSRFSEFGPTLFWRTANLGADYTQVAPVMAAMFEKATGTPVDGVIQIDSMGLSALLRGIGPVTVPDLGEVNADNAVALTLNEAYTRFPDRPVRQEYLGQIAEAAFRKLLAGDYPSLKGLATAMTDATNRRNVIFWSSKAPGERAASYLHADGSLPDVPDFAGVTIENLSGNKLDYYLDSALRLEGDRPSGRLGHVRATIDLHNTAPRNGQPPYIFGPILPRFRNGEYAGLVNLYLPRGASVVGSSGLDEPESLAVAGEDDRTVVSFRTTLLAGDVRTVTFDLELTPPPPGGYHLDLVPFPRVRPTAVTVNIDASGGRRRFSGPLLTPTTVR